jgi:hypothetical protein
MLNLSVLTVGLAAVVGLWLAILNLRARSAGAMPVSLAALHGVLAIIGFGVLIVALGGPPRGLSTGTASFGMIAAVALGLAACVGFAMLAVHLRRRRVPGAVVGIHATLAISGFVVLAVYAMLG